jgi:NAD(P)-dependent dehydrogenase (short-subunit alcohol dehydrogenase family)
VAEEAGARAVMAQVDVRDPDTLATVPSEGVDRLGRLDTAVANAGVCTIQRWNEVDPRRLGHGDRDQPDRHLEHLRGHHPPPARGRQAAR